MGKVVIHSESCKSCLYCVKACPKKVLEKSDKLNQSGYMYVEAVHKEDCIGCGMCAMVCPDVAIEVYR